MHNRPLIFDEERRNPVPVTNLMPFTIFGFDPICTQTSKTMSNNFEFFGCLRYSAREKYGDILGDDITELINDSDYRFQYNDYCHHRNEWTKFHPCRIGELLTSTDAEKFTPQKILCIQKNTKIDDTVRWKKNSLSTIQLIINHAPDATGDFLSMLNAMSNLKAITLCSAMKNALSADMFGALALYLFDRNASRSLVSFVMHARDGGAPYIPIPATALLILFQLRSFDNFEALAIDMMRAYGYSAIADEFDGHSSRRKFESLIAYLLPQPIAWEMADHVLFIN
jgi:hypothetical protein